MVHTLIFQVHGMSCGACANGVKSRLQDIDGVGDAHVDLALETATVTHSGDVDFSHIQATFADTQYTVSVEGDISADDGMSMAL